MFWALDNETINREVVLCSSSCHGRINLNPYRGRFSVTAMSTRKNICAVGVADESLTLLDILDEDFFGHDSDVSDAASGSADSDSHEDSDLEPRAQRVSGDENSKAGSSVDENVIL